MKKKNKNPPAHIELYPKKWTRKCPLFVLQEIQLRKDNIQTMNRRKFNEGEIVELSRNVNVIKCSEKAITYSTDFKKLAVKKYLEDGMSPSEIFIEAGFEKFCLDKSVPKDRLKLWRKIYELKGGDGLSVERRGRCSIGRPKTKGITEADRIKRLEMEVLYLKAENAFLAKLRAERRE